MKTKEETMSELLTLSHLARRLGVTKKWLKAEAENGRVPSLKADGRFLFDLAAVEKVLRERAEKAVPHE